MESGKENLNYSYFNDYYFIPHGWGESFTRTMRWLTDKSIGIQLLSVLKMVENSNNIFLNIHLDFYSLTRQDFKDTSRN